MNLQRATSNEQRAFKHIIIVVYLWAALAGFLFTLFRIPLLAPRPVSFFMYMTMAPYQSYRKENEEYFAEGLTEDGVWEHISLEHYLPYGAGEQFVRSHMVSFRNRSEEIRSAAYLRQAYQILRIERAKGHPYQSLRLVMERWPVSPRGLERNRTPELTERAILAIAS